MAEAQGIERGSKARSCSVLHSCRGDTRLAAAGDVDWLMLLHVALGLEGFEKASHASPLIS